MSLAALIDSMNQDIEEEYNMETDIRILHLTLKKKWFDLIAKGEKTTEYREIKDYWTTRLLDTPWITRVYDEIHFRNGYSKESPFMRVEWLATNKDMFEGKLCYALRLGKIYEIKNWVGE